MYSIAVSEANATWGRQCYADWLLGLKNRGQQRDEPQ
jgi:hypothetical protein